MKIFGREPTLVIQAISAALAVLVTFGMSGLSATQAALIVAVLSAVLGVVNALMVRPVAPAAFTGLVAAVAALLAGYGFHVAQQTVGAVQVAVVAVLALLTRVQVTPADPRTPADAGRARPLVLVAVTVLALVGLSAPAMASQRTVMPHVVAPAHWYDSASTGGMTSASDSGSCALPGGRAYAAAYDSGHILNELSINSTPELAQASSKYVVYNSSNKVLLSGVFEAHPIDGDGYWNYLWDNHPLNVGGWDHVVVTPKQKSGGAVCSVRLDY